MERARRYCSTPTCHNRVTGPGKCPRCRTQRDRARGGATARGYDTAWATFSKRWLDLHRWCGERADFRLHAEHSHCVQRGARIRATVTDHVLARARGGSHMDPANHQSLCATCNRRKAVALEGALRALR
jgi:5-methylcytosine-specific restriction protein A